MEGKETNAGPDEIWRASFACSTTTDAFAEIDHGSPHILDLAEVFDQCFHWFCVLCSKEKTDGVETFVDDFWIYAWS